MSAGPFLTLEEDRHRQVVGSLFMQALVRLAGQALQDGVRLWRLRPKVHKIHHMVIDQRLSFLNPAHNACWMDEDCVKRVMRLARAVDKRTMTISMLQRYLLGLPQTLREARAEKLERRKHDLQLYGFMVIIW